MITLTKDIDKANFVTHAGNFHADDVFSTVFLSKLYGDITVIRVKDYKDDGSKLAYDIGLGKFDHHQAGYNKKRENGIHYCGFGLLWKEFGLKYLKQEKIANVKEVYNVFDYLLINNIDAFDNGEFDIKSSFNVYTIPSLVEIFRPKDKEDEDECFLKATEFANFIFDLVLKEAISKVNAIEKIRKVSSSIKNKVLILEEYIPYEFALFYLKLDVDFVIYPSNRGGWAAHTVPTFYKGFELKVPFKKEWAGLRNEELAKVSGVKTAKFCHNKLFLATAETLDDAKLFVSKTIGKEI